MKDKMERKEDSGKKKKEKVIKKYTWRGKKMKK